MRIARLGLVDRHLDRGAGRCLAATSDNVSAVRNVHTQRCSRESLACPEGPGSDDDCGAGNCVESMTASLHGATSFVVFYGYHPLVSASDPTHRNSRAVFHPQKIRSENVTQGLQLQAGLLVRVGLIGLEPLALVARRSSFAVSSATTSGWRAATSERSSASSERSKRLHMRPASRSQMSFHLPCSTLSRKCPSSRRWA